MRKFLILILVLLSSPLGLFAGRVFVTSAGWDADLKVYFTDKRYEADILVYVSSYGYEARGKDAIWHYVQHKYQADLKVFVTSQRYQANLVVYVTPYRYEAGWKRSHPWTGRLFK